MSSLSQHDDPKKAGPGEVDEPTLLDYVARVWRRRWLVGGLCVATVLVTFVVTIRMPKIYESTAAMLAPKEASSTLGVLGSLAGMSGLQLPGLSGGSMSPNRDMLVGILKSRTAAEAVVDKFGLQERYKARYKDQAIRIIQDTADVTVSREGVISLKFEDTDPNVAAAMGNFFVDNVDRLVTAYNMGQSGRQYEFIATHLANARVNLDRAEQTFRAFQERNRAIGLPEQTRVAIEGAAELKGQITALEVQLQGMRAFVTEKDPAVISMRRRIEEMERHLSKLQYGDRIPGQTARAADRQDFVVPFAKVPEVGLELARVTRDVKLQQTLVEVLTSQLEQSRIARVQDLPVVQVLDRPVPAERPSKPRLVLNLAIAAAVSLMFAVVLATFLDHLKSLRQSRLARR